MSFVLERLGICYALCRPASFVTLTAGVSISEGCGWFVNLIPLEVATLLRGWELGGVNVWPLDQMTDSLCIDCQNESKNHTASVLVSLSDVPITQARSPADDS